MHQQITQLSAIQLVGMTTRTSNALEMDPNSAQISGMMQRFFASHMQEKISHRKYPGKVFSVYTNYESDFNGEYTYFLGEEVTLFENIPACCSTLTIPPQAYMKFTSEPGQMPAVVIKMWQKIWEMDPIQLGGERAYVADFEVYGERSSNPNNTILDIYIGIKK